MSLILKYRPRTFAEIIGQDSVVKSLQQVLKNKTSRGFIFESPTPGVGKTTLARLAAKEVGCVSRNIVEVDAATTNGIDAMRAITGGLIYKAMGASPSKMVILDEAAQLSKASWTSLLKTLEEPPPDVYFSFCTTDGQKIPKAIRTRCSCYTLSPVSVDDIDDLLTRVAKAEGFNTSEKVISFISRKSDGSPRQALASLAMCADCETVEEAGKILQTVVAEGDIADLCKAMAEGKWQTVMGVVKGLEETNTESIRMTVLAWFGKIVKEVPPGAKKFEFALKVLDAFARPYVSSGNHELILSLADVLL
jgi:DNA polymerase III subunit gamma/tau